MQMRHNIDCNVRNEQNQDGYLVGNQRDYLERLATIKMQMEKIFDDDEAFWARAVE